MTSAEQAAGNHHAPRVAEREPAPRHLVGSVWFEIVAIRCAFQNWLPMLVAIAAGRLRGQPPALEMRVRRGPTLRTPEGDRSWWTAVECFGRDCYRLGAMQLRAAPVVVDVGANVGAFTLALLVQRPDAQVAAYDASPAAVAVLAGNIAANNAGNQVTVHHNAVVGAADQSTIWLNEHVGDLCTSSVLDSRDPVGSVHRVAVPAVALSTILSAYPGDVDLVKLDVEGAEYEIVQQTPIELLGKVQWMVVEYHDVPGHDLQELASCLAAAGMVWVRQVHSALPRQGLAWWVKESELR